MIESPLVMKTLFTVGPVPITEPVVVTWGLMAVLTLGGFLATRSLALSPSRYQAVLELIVGAIEDQIQRHDACRAEALRANDRHAVPFHPRGKLVFAGSRHRPADGTYRNRCGAWSDCVFCDHLFRHSAHAAIGGYLRHSPSRPSS